MGRKKAAVRKAHAQPRSEGEESKTQNPSALAPWKKWKDVASRLHLEAWASEQWQVLKAWTACSDPESPDAVALRAAQEGLRCERHLSPWSKLPDCMTPDPNDKDAVEEARQEAIRYAWIWAVVHHPDGPDIYQAYYETERPRGWRREKVPVLTSLLAAVEPFIDVWRTARYIQSLQPVLALTADGRTLNGGLHVKLGQVNSYQELTGQQPTAEIGFRVHQAATFCSKRHAEAGVQLCSVLKVFPHTKDFIVPAVQLDTVAFPVAEFPGWKERDTCLLAAQGCRTVEDIQNSLIQVWDAAVCKAILEAKPVYYATQQRWHGKLEFLPKQAFTEALYCEAVTLDERNFEHVPQECLTPKVILAGMKADGFNLKHLRPEQQTPEYCRLAVTKTPSAIRFVDQQTPELVDIALEKWPDTIQYVHEGLMSESLAIRAVSSPNARTNTVSHVPEQWRTLAVWQAALLRKPKAIKSLPAAHGNYEELCWVALKHAEWKAEVMDLMQGAPSEAMRAYVNNYEEDAAASSGSCGSSLSP